MCSIDCGTGVLVFNSVLVPRHARAYESTSKESIAQVLYLQYQSGETLTHPARASALYAPGL
jgi:hypothetical protein